MASPVVGDGLWVMGVKPLNANEICPHALKTRNPEPRTASGAST